jgi:argonaute-like protein implicated in RNA metabolism and viral defense
MAGIPAQNIRLSKLNQAQKDLQYTLQNLTVALYAKMNGTPWTVDHDQTISDELVIGVGTCELSGSRFTERQRFVGITTVFRADGNYLLGNLSNECTYDEYPDVLRDSTLSILQEIKNQNNWRPGDTIRLVFHAARPLKNVDIAEITAQCVAQIGSEQNIEFAFLTISHDHPFTILDKSQRGIVVKNSVRKGIYAPERGTILQLGRYTRLLSTSSPRLIKRPSTPLPTPLLIHLHPQSTYYDQTYLSEQVLKFTSLSWKSVFPASDPVTIYYSELIAGLLARLKNVPGWSPAMLNIKLRASKWFL